jgi:hypothetical protein
LALHELRYALGYGSHADEELAAQGHGYLPFATLAAGLLLALAAAALLAGVVRAWRTGAGEGAQLPLGLTWLAASLALTGVYSGQELLEGALAAGHQGGLGALAGHGGLVAYPLAFALGALVALALRGARALVGAAARSRPPLLPRARPGHAGPLFTLHLVRRGTLADGCSLRGPPVFP